MVIAMATKSGLASYVILLFFFKLAHDVYVTH